MRIQAVKKYETKSESLIHTYIFKSRNGIFTKYADYGESKPKTENGYEYDFSHEDMNEKYSKQELESILKSQNYQVKVFA